jgi:hypothetical protein
LNFSPDSLVLGCNWRNFKGKTQKNEPGFQFDLIFDRDDRVITLCEMKYSQATIGTGVIEEFERKLELFPNPKRKTIQKVLVTTEGVKGSSQKTEKIVR